MTQLAVLRAGGVARVVWALPLRLRNTRGELLRIVGLLALLLFVGLSAGMALLHVHLADHAEPTRAAHRFAAGAMPIALRVACITIGLVVYCGQILLSMNVPLQNDPTAARLVPGHVTSLRAASLLVWAAGSAITIACAAVAAGWLGVLFAAMTSVFAALLMLGAKDSRWMLAVAVAPSLLLASGILRVPARLAAKAGMAHPLLVVGVAVCTAVFAAWFAIDGGDARHRRRFDARRMLLQRGSWQALRTQPGKHRVLDWLTAPSSRWLRPIDDARSKPFDRLMLGFGPELHWTSLLKMAGRASALFVVLALVQETWHGMHGGFLRIAPMVWLGIAGSMGTPLVARALVNTRAEQALLRLLPTAPSGADLTRRIGARGVVSALLPLGAIAPVLLGLALIQRLWPPYQAAAWVLAATALGSLPCLSLLRDWSRVQTSTTHHASSSTLLPMMAGLATSYLAGAWVLWLHQSALLPVLVATMVGGLTVARWRRRSARWPVMIPVGRGARARVKSAS